MDAPDKVPSEIRLLKAGSNEYAAGDTDAQLLFDADSAQQVMARYQKRGIRLKADYEHQSLQQPPIQAPASAKRWTPEIRKGELWATDIQWTRKARQMIADGEYDYFSIAARRDTSNRITEIINFALTNNPAANGIEPLVAASITAQPEKRMKTVIVALGLRADAEEADALAAVSSLKEFEREIVTLSGKSDRAGALGALRAMHQSHEQVVSLTASVKQLEADKRGQEFDALVKKGQDAVQISPAMANGEWLKALRGKEDGVAQLTSFLASAPKLIAGDAPREVVKIGETAEGFTKEEIAIAKTMTGGDPVALKANLTALAAYKRERAELFTGAGR